MKKLAVCCLSLAAMGAYAHTAKFICDWKNPVVVETSGKLVMEHPYNLNGNMFVGWKGPGGKMYQKWQETTIDKDERFVVQYAPLDLSIWTNGSDGVPKRHKAGDGILYAIGDSITFGTKVGGNGGSWAAKVASSLGLGYVNDARAGSRLTSWRSVLTHSGNHNQRIEELIDDVSRDRLLLGVRSAGVIAFTLGTNDLLFNNKGEDVAYRMFEFVEALHHENPKALIVAVGGKNSEAFRPGAKYGNCAAASDKLWDSLRLGLNGPKFRDYCIYVDITDIFSDKNSYIPCERSPDGVHPGHNGHAKIAEKVLSLVEKRPGAKASAVPKALSTPPPAPGVKSDPVAKLPSEAEMWSLADAGREKTATREKFSLNGLWAFKVDNAAASFDRAPQAASMDYYFKVPGEWPSCKADARDGMAIYTKTGADAAGAAVKSIDSAWYARRVKVPESWRGRDIVVGFQWIPTIALVYVDGKKSGEVFFPGGEVSLGDLAPGEHEIAFFTSAKLAETMVTAFDAPDTARSFTKKRAAHAGVNGDVYIAAEPKGTRIDNVQVRPNVKGGRIDFRVEFAAGAAAEPGATVIADVYDGEKKVKTFSGQGPVVGGEWKGAKLWDLDALDNIYTVKVRIEKGGKVVDELYPETFGFRDIELKGREVLLNGTPVHFRPCNTAYSHAGAVANEDIRKAAVSRRAYGFNMFVPTSNYGFSEGDVTTFEVMLREGTKGGMTYVVGLPHPSKFDNPKNPHHWQYGPEYDRLVKYMIKRFQNVPGLIFWSSTHNATGYESDQNPEIISGRPDEIPTGIINWRQRFRRLALTVDEKMKDFDPTRPVYHHESGAEGSFYTLNCYLDWAPIQERSDWFEHWQEKGIMPLLIVEWGTPHIASWSTFRGGPNSVNIWSAYNWTQHCWMNEYNASFLGERAFVSTPAKKFMMARIQWNCKGNKACYYGGNFTQPLIDEADTSEVLSMYAKRNYRDMRARGVTSFLPWDIDGGTFFTNNPAIPRARTVRADPFRGIKDFGVVRSDYYSGLLDQADELPRQIGKTLKETYTDLLGWIAGPAGQEFTRVNDAFRPGEKVEKSLVILNDSRRPREIEWVWKAGGTKKSGKVTVQPGGRADIPIAFAASADTTTIAAGFRCAATGWKSSDKFSLNLLPAKAKAKVSSKVFLFDPEGTAAPVLAAIGVRIVDASATRPGKGDILVVGRNAFQKLPFSFAETVGSGVKVVVLEQDAATLKKMGFRLQEHGLRNLFAATGDFAGLDMTDWRGNATSLPEYLKEDKMKGDFATTDWEGYKNRRVWRAGNRGIVSAVLPEKPTKGDFLPLLHGGFNLQYAPVMEYSEPGRRIILSQLDICGRTEASPEAEEALAKILELADRPLPGAAPRILVLEWNGRVAKEFADLGIRFEKAASASDAKAGDILVLGPGANCGELKPVAESGVKVLILGLRGRDVARMLPEERPTECKWAECPEFNASLAGEPLLRGVSNADIQWVYPSNVGERARFGNDLLIARHYGKGAIVCSSIVPWIFDENEIALRVNRRRAQGLISRLVANLGGTVDTSFLTGAKSLYADKPLQDDDPYRYYRW